MSEPEENITSLYEILNVTKDSSIEEIKKSYKSLAKQYHPDVGGDEEAFRKISEAYKILSNEELREKYDNGELNIEEKLTEPERRLEDLFTFFLSNYLEEALEHNNMIHVLKEKIKLDIKEHKEAIRENLKSIKNLEQLEKIIQKKENVKGLNLFEKALKTEILTKKENNLRINEEISILREIKLLLKDYKDVTLEKESMSTFLEGSLKRLMER